MYFHRHELNPIGDAYEVVLYLEPHHSLEEFAEEFGLSIKAEEDINRVAIGYVKRKFPTLRIDKIKVMMGSALVTTIVFGGLTQASAEENTIGVEDEFDTTIPEDDIEIGDLETVPFSEVPTIPMNEVESEEGTALSDPGHVPGDFFYFIEIVAEKIQLALTFGDTTKAELMSQFANEHIAAANALFAEGNTDEAINGLNKALESHELALDYTPEPNSLHEDGPDEEDPVPEELKDITPPIDQGLVDKGVMDTEEEVEEAEEPVNGIREELQNQFSKNITALLLAMEKVNKPTAKAILARNVEEVFAKMEKKFGKLTNIEEQFASNYIVDEPIEELHENMIADQEEFEVSLTKVHELENES
ncbi:DUF5667 domain-containing protein [Ornithinibacillus salinisoli]|uniref:DUF5667 domain-containing protein n=1 Tax=Ornithinibacillus salinisoli TaxID=1848459 RepID=A0ABW4W0Z5_9BACI